MGNNTIDETNINSYDKKYECYKILRTKYRPIKKSYIYSS
jgi:hypothetical protein